MFNYSKTGGSIKADCLSGLTVALALVPEAIAFSFIAGVPPAVGLWSAVFLGLITSAVGGRPGMISGATAAIALVAKYAVDFGNEQGDGLGLHYLWAVIMVAGLIQLLFGVFKLGRFIRLVPHPVMIGFVNGLAIAIFLGQLPFFTKTTHIDDEHKLTQILESGPLAIMIVLVLASMAIIHFFPKLTKAVPSTLVAIVLVSLAAYFIPDVRTISTVLMEGAKGASGSMEGSFPLPVWPSGVDWAAHWGFILKISFSIAMVGIIESLMTMQLIDEKTETRGHGDQECLAQGGANVLSALFGGMGGCAMIGQSMININSGGRGRLSGIFAAVMLALFILILSPIIEKIPIAALVGVMFMVVIGTFDWSTFKSFGKVPWTEIAVILAVTLVTVFMHNLALAVFVGVILSALAFAWESSKHVHVSTVKDGPDERIYAVEGLLYFGSVREFSDNFQAKSDVPNIVIDFEEARVCDLSGLEAINALGTRYENAGKKLQVRHLSPDCRRMLEKAGTLVDIAVLPDDPQYTVAKLRGRAEEEKAND